MRRAPEHAACLLAVALALGAGGCSGLGVARWLPAPLDYPRFPYGAAATVYRGGSYTTPLRGEFIALEADTLLILGERGLVAVPLHEVGRVRLTADRRGQLRAPSLDLAWLRSRYGTIPEQKREQLRSFARFPGGLPDSLDRGSLRLPPGR